MIMMKKVSLLVLAIALLALASCKSSPKSEESVSNINNALQDCVAAILEKHLVEYGAMDGVAIIMETESGKIRAMVGLDAKGDSTYERVDSLAASKHSSALMRTVSVLAALNTGKVKSGGMFDSGEGIFVYDNDTIYDHNWRKGGYGELTLWQTLAYSSDIGILKAVDEAFPDKKDFLASVRKMSFGQSLEVEGLKVDSCVQDSEMPWCYYAMGFQEITPLQMLAFYNAIANKDSIASPSSIADIHGMLEGVVSKGLAKCAMSDKVKVAGMNGTIRNEDSTLTADFCGYFPADKPKYTILVSVHRKEVPAAGGRMAGTIFREIAEFIDRCKDTIK